jgi:Tol biopolymer transport system component
MAAMNCWSLRRTYFLPVLLLVLIGLAGALQAPAASAASVPEKLFQIPKSSIEPSEGPGKLDWPQDVSADSATGHVYVADAENHRIGEFTSWGTFVKAWGWRVADGVTPALQICTAPCFRGLPGAGRGQLDLPVEVLADGFGGIYVLDEENHRVQKFSTAGEFLWMAGGEVNRTKSELPGADPAETNLCPIDPGDVCQQGAPGGGPAQFSPWRTGSEFAAAMALNGAGNVYVGDRDRIQELSPDGEYLREIPLPIPGEVRALAVDPTSQDIFFAYGQWGLHPSPGIYRIAPDDGEVLETIDVSVPVDLALDSAGTLYVIDNETLQFPDPVIRRFAAGEEILPVFGIPPKVGSIYHELTGLATNVLGDGTSAPGTLYVTAAMVHDPVSYLTAYGPLPQFEPAPAVPPTIGSQFATTVGATSVSLKAEVNPHFYADTRYYVEYGAAPCSAGSCATQPSPPGDPLGAERDELHPTGDLQITGLQPGTEYHFRFVAVSGEFEVKGPDRTFTTHRAGPFALPDGRQVEMVSPPQKNSGEVAVRDRGSGGLVDSSSIEPLQAAASGESVTYGSFTAFADPKSAPAASQYVSTRSAQGWITENVSPPDQEGYTRNPVRGFSEDLAQVVVGQREPTLAPGAFPGFENFYLRSPGGALRALTTVESPRTDVLAPEFCIAYAGASENFERIIFLANGAIVPQAPEGTGMNLYEWSAEDGIRLVSVLPNDEPAPPSPYTGFGAGQVSKCSVGQRIVRNAISDDGAFVFWTLAGGQGLFARIEGEATIQLDLTQGFSGPGGTGRYWGASSNGSKVFLTSANKLTPEGASGDLYRYDFNVGKNKRLTNLTSGSGPANVQGMVGINDAGDTAYFVATGVLTDQPGAAVDPVSGEPAKAIAGQANLYVWREGEPLEFVATLQGGLSSSDAQNWSESPTFPNPRTAQVSPDGDELAFTSLRALTGDENRAQVGGEPVRQVYLYDAVAEALVCASCSPTGTRPLGGSDLAPQSTPYSQPRSLTADGSRLVFESEDALALHDTNGRRDVYQFEHLGTGGCTVSSSSFVPQRQACIALLSTGRSDGDSYFVDASAAGDDVFISTHEALVPWDDDQRYDVYDLRVGGGLPGPPSDQPGCSGEACRPIVPPPPAVVPPGSSSFGGQGNVRQEKPRKKQAKKKKRSCKKKKGKRCQRGKAGKGKGRSSGAKPRHRGSR